jgi:hypothetical protein
VELRGESLPVLHTVAFPPHAIDSFENSHRFEHYQAILREETIDLADPFFEHLVNNSTK